MPLYEFYCQKCNNNFETLLKIKDLEQGACCPKCGNENTQKQISLPYIETSSTGGGYPYFSDNLADDAHPYGQTVQSREHRKQLLKEQGKKEF